MSMLEDYEGIAFQEGDHIVRVVTYYFNTNIGILCC